MPLYRYRCPVCLWGDSQFRKIAERDVLPVCAGVGENSRHDITSMARVLEAPMVKDDFAGYSCPVTGKWIEGRRAHEENLKRHGARVLEPGETAAYRSGLAAEDAKLEKEVGETVDAELAAMPARKVEQLVTELQAGADVSYQRATGKVAQNG